MLGLVRTDHRRMTHSTGTPRGGVVAGRHPVPTAFDARTSARRDLVPTRSTKPSAEEGRCTTPVLRRRPRRYTGARSGPRRSAAGHSVGVLSRRAHPDPDVRVPPFEHAVGDHHASARLEAAPTGVETVLHELVGSGPSGPPPSWQVRRLTAWRISYGPVLRGSTDGARPCLYCFRDLGYAPTDPVPTCAPRDSSGARPGRSSSRSTSRAHRITRARAFRDAPGSR